MQWDDTKYAGFSTGEPWLPVSPQYKTVNVKKALQDEYSMLTLYKTLLRLRKTLTTIHSGKYIAVSIDNESVFAYIRSYGNENLLVVLNFSGDEQIIKLPYHEMKFILNTYLDHKDPEIKEYTFRLRSHEGWILRVRY